MLTSSINELFDTVAARFAIYFFVRFGNFAGNRFIHMVPQCLGCHANSTGHVAFARGGMSFENHTVEAE